MICCNITLEFKSEEMAENILKSVEIDNEGYVKSHREGNKIMSIIKGDNPLSLLHTIEDFLSCVKVAEQAACL